MPCHDPDDSPTYLYGRISNLTRMLCGLCQATEDRMEYWPADVAEWWKAHQEDDRKRRAAEEAREREKELRAQALSKLSPEERRALRLD